jgi:hypothetical protein
MKRTKQAQAVAFVSILALFCVWTKSLMCNDAGRPSVPVPSVRTMCHSVRTPDRQASSVRTTCSFRSDPFTVSRSFCSSLLRLDVSASRPDAYQFSNGSLILSKIQERKINQPSGRCRIPSGRVSP